MAIGTCSRPYSFCNVLCTDNIVSNWHDTVGRRVKASGQSEEPKTSCNGAVVHVGEREV